MISLPNVVLFVSHLRVFYKSGLISVDQSDVYLLLSRDSSLDGVGVLSARKGSNSKFSKKSSLDDAKLQIHELNHSLNTNMSLR